MKKTTKAIIPLVLMAYCSLGMANNIVLKCVDGNGNVTYANEKSAGLTCERTDIDKKVMQITNTGGSGYAPKARTGSSSNAITPAPANIPNVTSEEQKKKDLNRIAILENELKDERDSVEKVNKMIANAGSDQDQIRQLSDLKARHEQNIKSLEREVQLQSKR